MGEEKEPIPRSNCNDSELISPGSFLVLECELDTFAMNAF